MYSSIVKGSTFSTLYKNIRLKKATTGLIKNIMNFKFSTCNKKIFSLKNSFIKTQSRKFSEAETESKKTIYLNQQEAHMMNEHDRMITQLTSNVVPMTALPKFMKELLEYCFLLSKYKDYVVGWTYISKFFAENLKNFTNEDLEHYTNIFCLTGYQGHNDTFWSDVGQEILNRTLSKDGVLNYINLFAVNQVMSNEYLTQLVRKLENFQLNNYSDFILLAGDLGQMNFPKNDTIWETILANIESKDIQIKDFSPPYLIKAAISLKQNVQRDSPFYENVRNYFLSNFKSIQAEYIPSVCQDFVKLNPPSVSDLVQLISQSFPSVSSASDYAKFEFYKLILQWCQENSSLRTELENSKNIIGQNFVVPTMQLLKDFADYQSQLKTLKHLEEIEALHESFWVKYATPLGFNTAFAQSVAHHGIYNYDALRTINENLKI
jgi:hypothetical protein